ncbi:MAG: YceH family protein [Solirubrobacteraceae bacterium]
MDLEPAEIRVLGCLLEKQRTTPDAYPLSLNALRLACNQSTNRDPVVDYDEAVVRDALHRLGRRRFTRLASGAASRAPKYRHLLDEALPMGRDEEAVMCVLMLRGPQTPGELKQRADRMQPFPDLERVGVTLERLIARGLVARLDRRPGQKEERYEELLGTDHDAATLSAPAAPTAAAPAAPAAPAASAAAPPEPPTPEPRNADLERRVARLELEVAALREALGG